MYSLSILCLSLLIIAACGQQPFESRPSSRFAYVSLLCDPINEDRADYIRMLLVLKESIRQFDNDNDIISMVYGGINEEQWEILDREGIKIVQVDSVASRVSNPEALRVPDDVSDCYRSKVNVLDFTEYKKVVFLDSDAYLKRDIRFMFEVQDEFYAYEGYESPLNTGLFAVRPSHKAFEDIQQILRSDAFNPEDGWDYYGPFPHWRLEGHMSDWSFWCAHTDQGILYFYYDKIAKTASIHSMEEASKLVVHFTGWNKPVLHGGQDFERSSKNVDVSFAAWYSLWSSIESRLDGTGLEQLKTMSRTQRTDSHAVSRRGLVDPYCDPYEPVSVWVYNAVTDTKIGPLGKTVDCSGPPITLVAKPDCKEKVKFKMTEATTGEVVAKNTEKVPPMSLGDDDGDDLYASSALRVPGSYELKVNPAPGENKYYSFDIKC